MATEKVNVVIAGKVFPLKLTKAEKKIASEIEQSINDQLSQLQSNYKNLSLVDTAIMVLIQKEFATARVTDSKALEQKIDNINRSLESISE